MNNAELKARELANKIFDVQTMKHAIHTANIQSLLSAPASGRDTKPSRKLQILKEMAAAYQERENEILAAIDTLSSQTETGFAQKLHKHYKAIQRAVTGDLKFHARRKRERKEARAQSANPVTA